MVSAFVTEREVVICYFKGTAFILKEKPAVIQFFQEQYVYFQKKLIPAMRSFKGTIIISTEDSQPSIFETVLYIFLILKFVAIQFC